MSPLPRLRLPFSLRCRTLTAVAAALRQDTATWTQAPLSLVAPASADASLFHVAVDVSDAPDLAVSYTAPGQYLQLRVPAADKPAFLALASPPSFAASRAEFQFLVKRVPGSTVDLLCGLGRGDVVELSGIMGRGFQVERISPPDAFPSVLIFATGSGISPIRSLIESGFNANERSDVRLYYGARNFQRMAYQDRFKDWESTGVKIIPVLSQPDERWGGERGYVQAAFLRAKQILNPSSTGAVLCGHKKMTEVCEVQQSIFPKCAGHKKFLVEIPECICIKKFNQDCDCSVCMPEIKECYQDPLTFSFSGFSLCSLYAKVKLS